MGKSQIVLSGKRYPSDCTGMVRGVFDQLGIDLTQGARPGDNGVTAIYRYAASHGHIYQGGHPVPGDLVFFRETYDVNRDGRTNDGLTHVGIVDALLEDGTVVVIHRVARGVVRYRMNLQHPEANRDPRTGRILNDYLRSPGGAHRGVLTAQLFAAYATLLPIESRYARR